MRPCQVRSAVISDGSNAWKVGFCTSSCSSGCSGCSGSTNTCAVMERACSSQVAIRGQATAAPRQTRGGARGRPPIAYTRRLSVQCKTGRLVRCELFLPPPAPRHSSRSFVHYTLACLVLTTPNTWQHVPVCLTYRQSVPLRKPNND